MATKTEQDTGDGNSAVKDHAAGRGMSATTIELISRGRSIIDIEANALGRLAQMLDEGFARAVRLLIETRMRVIVTGMGKSGNIGRKIAATLSATGTPATFVHPADAAHGDLGMIMPGDVLLVLSNSGKTHELRFILDYARSLECPIIGVASQLDSPVMRAADIQILLPDAREACPANIAPTTSTTLMLALGDALAVTVMGVRGVSLEKLGSLHPGGPIGLHLTPVSALMRTGNDMDLVAPDLPMRNVLVGMTERRIGIAGVVDADGHLIGVITDGDLRRNVDQLLTSSAREVMTTHPQTIPHSMYAGEAMKVMTERRITALYVVNEEQPRIPIGLVHIHDFGAPTLV